MQDYNHKRPHDALGNMPPIKYAKINSNRFKSIRIKNNNFEKVEN